MLRTLTRILIVIAVLALVLGPFLRHAQTRVFSWSENEAVVEAIKAKRYQKKSSGNAFVRVLKAPFKAIGKLFRRGKKDPNKLRRLSEKDVARFENTRVIRTVDARSIPPEKIIGDVHIRKQKGAKEHDSLALLHLESGRRLLKAGQLNAAITNLSQAVAVDDDLAEAHNLLGIAYEAKGLRTLALKSFRECAKRKNAEFEHLNNYGYLLFRNGDYSRAKKYLKKAVKIEPNNERGWNNLALVQTQMGKFNDAYKSFARGSDEYQGRMNVAIRLQRLGYHKKAIKHLEKARALKPNKEVLARLVKSYDETGKRDRAFEARKSLLALETQSQVTETPAQVTSPQK